MMPAGGLTGRARRPGCPPLAACSRRLRPKNRIVCHTTLKLYKRATIHSCKVKRIAQSFAQQARVYNRIQHCIKHRICRFRKKNSDLYGSHWEKSSKSMTREILEHKTFPSITLHPSEIYDVFNLNLFNIWNRVLSANRVKIMVWCAKQKIPSSLRRQANRIWALVSFS